MGWRREPAEDREAEVNQHSPGFEEQPPNKAPDLGPGRLCPAGSLRYPVGGSSGASGRARMVPGRLCCAPTPSGPGSHLQTGLAGPNLRSEKHSRSTGTDSPGTSSRNPSWNQCNVRPLLRHPSSPSEYLTSPQCRCPTVTPAEPGGCASVLPAPARSRPAVSLPAGQR